MKAHFRPNEFLLLQFSKEEFFVAYDFLCRVQRKNPTLEVATMLEAMERYLFPAPKLALVATEHLCMKCAMMIPKGEEVYTLIRKGDKSKGEADLYGNKHKDQCPMLKSPSERG